MQDERRQVFHGQECSTILNPCERKRDANPDRLLEQREVAPNVWMPTHYSYDFDGRKFIFSLNVHERMEYTDYLRVGPPEEALAVIRREHPSIFANQN